LIVGIGGPLFSILIRVKIFNEAKGIIGQEKEESSLTENEDKRRGITIRKSIR